MPTRISLIILWSSRPGQRGRHGRGAGAGPMLNISRSAPRGVFFERSPRPGGEVMHEGLEAPHARGGVVRELEEDEAAEEVGGGGGDNGTEAGLG